MAPGKRPHKVSIMGPTVTQDELGNQIETMAVLASAWASVEPLSGREYYAAAQIQAETTHIIKMRPPGIQVLKTYEFEFNGRTFEIESVRDLGEKGAELVFMCKEKE